MSRTYCFELAAQALKDANYYQPKAAAALERLTKTDPAAAIGFLRGGILQELRMVLTALRNRSTDDEGFTTPPAAPTSEPDIADREAAAAARRATVVKFWDEWPLFGGMMLAQARLDDLDEAIDRWDALARGNAARRDFVKGVRRMLAGMPAGSQVRDLTLAKVEKLKKKYSV